MKALTDDTSLALQRMSELSSCLLKSGYPDGLVNSAVANAMKLSTVELRKPKHKSTDERILTFVHTFDPAHPDLFWKIKNLVSRLFTSAESRPIFEDTRIIDSRREPSNLMGLLQHSRFDESRGAAWENGVTKCGIRNCKLCSEIMETDQVFFKNDGCSIRINAKMDCTVKNVVYALFCGGCAHSYIGETVCLRERANSHRANSYYQDSAVMEVSRHLYGCGQGFKICPIVKVREECKILRLVIEDGMIKLLKPDLNTDQRNLLHLRIVE